MQKREEGTMIYVREPDEDAGFPNRIIVKICAKSLSVKIQDAFLKMVLARYI